jgi:hypothetical protein
MTTPLRINQDSWSDPHPHKPKGLSSAARATDRVHLQHLHHLIAVVIDHLHSDLARLRGGKGSARRPIEAPPRLLVDVCARCPLQRIAQCGSSRSREAVLHGCKSRQSTRTSYEKLGPSRWGASAAAHPPTVLSGTPHEASQQGDYPHVRLDSIIPCVGLGHVMCALSLNNIQWWNEMCFNEID